MKKSLSLNESFAVDVFAGLSASPKFLSSKYFYDEIGDKLFQGIMKMEEYYLTRCEYEIFSSQKDELLSFFKNGGKRFNLIEFGAGDGYKTKVLLHHFLEKKVEFKYFPVDISANVLNLLEADLEKRFPGLEIKTLNNEYFQALEALNSEDLTKKVILFLGSNIGNFKEEEAIHFLQHIASNISSQDNLLIGFDLKKEPKIILDAYDDKGGITRDFNLNLLNRINNELGGNFDISKFQHYPLYDPISGQARSFIISKEDQDVEITELETTFHFNAWEPIHTEISQKYHMLDIKRLADQSGFKVVKNFYDSKKYYVNSLWSLK